MNTKTCKRIRKAVGYKPGSLPVYDKPAIHHLANFPVYRKGKLQLTLDPATGEHIPQTELVPVPKPRRLDKQSPKGIYRVLKRVQRTVGLDNLYNQLLAEAVPA